MNFLMILAQAATQPTTQGADAAPGWLRALESPYLLFGGAILLMLMFSNKGKRGEEKARAEQLKQLKRGDRIQTIGGIQGTVVTVEENRVAVKVDESSNVKMWFVRNAIAKVIETGTDAKSEK